MDRPGLDKTETLPPPGLEENQELVDIWGQDIPIANDLIGITAAIS